MTAHRRTWRRSSDQPGRIGAARVLILGLIGTGCLSPARADDEPANPAPFVAVKKWTTLHQMPAKPTAVMPLPDKGPLHVLNGLELTGCRPGDKSLFGNFTADADWGIDRGGLHPTQGKNAALLVASAEDFDLEGTMSAEGLGGWFFLVGWNERHGYLIYNVTLKTSGSPWVYCELRDGKGLEETHREINRHVWKGQQPFRLTVEKKALQFLVGKDQVIKDLELPNYHEGQILLGTYDTQYGPKPIRIQSLRIRAK